MGLDMYLNTNSPELIEDIYGSEFDEWHKGDVMWGHAAYWRKANAIHQWFVDNVQDGNDDCGTYPVYVEKLHELHKVICEVLDSSPTVSEEKEYTDPFTGKPFKRTETRLVDTTKAAELLPTSGGFFFGDTEYDDYYYDMLVFTKERLEFIFEHLETLKDFWDEPVHPKRKNWVVSFSYHASW